MNLFGWDTIFAVSVDKANAALAASPSIPKTFDYSVDSSAISMTGRFGAWSIVPGGSGELLRLEIPIVAGTFRMPGQGDAALDGVSMIVEVSLQLLPVSTTLRQLVFRFDKVGAEGDPQPGAVVPINLLDPNNRLNPAQHGVVFDLFPQYLVAHAGEISHVFASVDFARPETNSWLTPAEAAYAYVQKDDGSAFLAVLAVTTSRDVSQLPRNVDPGIVSGSNNAGILVSRDLYLPNVIEPALPATYPGTNDSTFQYSDATHSITNRYRFDTQGVRAGAITYHPRIDALAAYTSGSSLVTQVRGSVDLHARITMHFSLGVTSATAFDVQRQELDFLRDPHPSSSHSVHIPWYLKWLSPIAGAITGIVVNIITSSIANTLEDRARSTLTTVPPATVRWAGAETMRVSTAGLDGDFYMQGQV